MPFNQTSETMTLLFSPGVSYHKPDSVKILLKELFLKKKEGANIKTVVLIPGGLLQRHNLDYKKALKLEKNWLNSVAPGVAELASAGIECILIPWTFLFLNMGNQKHYIKLDHYEPKEFGKMLDEKYQSFFELDQTAINTKSKNPLLSLFSNFIKDLYEKDATIRKQIIEAAQKHIEAKKASNLNNTKKVEIPIEVQLTSSKEYIMEELAVFLFLGSTQNHYKKNGAQAVFPFDLSTCYYPWGNNEVSKLLVEIITSIKDLINNEKQTIKELALPIWDRLENNPLSFVDYKIHEPAKEETSMALHKQPIFFNNKQQSSSVTEKNLPASAKAFLALAKVAFGSVADSSSLTPTDKAKVMAEMVASLANKQPPIIEEMQVKTEPDSQTFDSHSRMEH